MSKLIKSFLFLSVVILLFGCSGEVRPPPPCATPLGCAEFRVTPPIIDQDRCMQSNNQKRNMWHIFNDHPSRDIFITLEERMESERNRSIKLFSRLVRSKKQLELDCEKRLHSHKIDRIETRSYVMKTACFVDDCEAVNNPLPPKPDPRALSCVDACDQGDDACLSYRLSEADPYEYEIGKELGKLAEIVLGHPIPFTHDTRDLGRSISALPGINCIREDLYTPSTDDIHWDGGICEWGMGIRHSVIDAVYLKLPQRIQGDFDRTDGVEAVIDSGAYGLSPYITYELHDNGKIQGETVNMTRLYPRKLLFEGEQGFCFELHW